MNIRICPGKDHLEDVVSLFREYTALLLEQYEEFRHYLEIQHYDAELENPLVKYGEPEGRLYIAYADGEPAGCGGLKPIPGDPDSCELKRLYVRPVYRGGGIGKMLFEKIVREARSAGYTTMKLDTLPFLTTAIDMYHRHGFYDIEPYNDSPAETTVFMAYDLRVAKGSPDRK